MPKVSVEGEGTYEVAPGVKLTLALEDAGIDVLHRCGGNARCTTCRVEILEGDAGKMGEAERERLARESDLGENTRLSCQVRVESDLTVRVLRRTSTTGLPAGPRPSD